MGVVEVETQLAQDFLASVERFRTWAATTVHEAAEWEFYYPSWSELYSSWEALLELGGLEHWNTELVDSALYAIARDNEAEMMADMIPPEALTRLAKLAIPGSEPDAKWQLAEQLGAVATSHSEALLLQLAADTEEYVRRRALQSLARLKSNKVTEIALREWARDEGAGNSRNNALCALHEVGSPAFGKLLEEALASKNDLVRNRAEQLRSAGSNGKDQEDRNDTSSSCK